jgi:hypothetical protein
MKLVSYCPLPVLIGLFLAGLSVPAVHAQTNSNLSADDIIARAVERAQSPANHALRPPYRYAKHTVFEELDSQGRLKERREKLYDVRVESGLTRLKLVELNGEPLSATEQQKRDAEDLAQRQKMTDSSSAKKSDERENFLTADLVARYKFTLLHERMLDGRDTYEIAFEPRSAKLPINHLTDRFLNQVAGTVWIDAAEFEIARAEIHLQGEVTLWGGMVGTLTQCSYTLKRVREPDGVWFNGDSHGFFAGRRLLEPMMIRTRSDSTGFQKLDLAFK